MSIIKFVRKLSIRLAAVIVSIVGLGQTCSNPGRSIFLNLALLRDTLAFIERTEKSGILLSLDQEKAFDCVERSFLLSLLEFYSALAMVSDLHCDPSQ